MRNCLLSNPAFESGPPSAAAQRERYVSMQTIATTLIAASLLLFSPGLAAAPWEWVKVISMGGKGLKTEQGPAAVTIKGRSFEAQLFWGDSPKAVRIELSGTIEKGQVKAIETVRDTDMGPSTYTGIYIYKKLNIKTSAGTIIGREAITLSDGYNIIGIRRHIWK